MEPQSVPYYISSEVDGIAFSYKYNVLAESGNNRYARKEQASLIKVVAVKLENNTGKDISVKDNLKFMINNHPATVLSPARVKTEIKQGSLGYLFFLLLTPMQAYKTDENGTSSFPIGLIVGPGLTLLNMSKASSANHNLEKTILNNNIISKTVRNGETGYGFLCIQSSSYDPISIKLIPEIISDSSTN